MPCTIVSVTDAGILIDIVVSILCIMITDKKILPYPYVYGSIGISFLVSTPKDAYNSYQNLGMEWFSS